EIHLRAGPVPDLGGGPVGSDPANPLDQRQVGVHHLCADGEGERRGRCRGGGTVSGGPHRSISSIRTSRRSAWERRAASASSWRSEEHTSELQSRFELVCRLLL